MVNLLQNGDFSDGPARPIVLVGYEGLTGPGAPGPAPAWSVWNNGYRPVVGDAIWTSANVQNLQDINIVLAAPEVVSSFKTGPNGAADVYVAEVRTNGGWDGLFQYFDFVPGARATLWAFVIEGGCYAALATPGKPSIGKTSISKLQWEQIEFTVDSETLEGDINEFIVYSPETIGAWFFVAQVVVEATS